MDQPKIHTASDAQWKDYYERKYINTDNQLRDLAYLCSHLVRLALEGKKHDVYMLAQRAVRRLEFQRDKYPIIEELKRYQQYAGSILREEAEGGKDGK